VYLVPHSSYYQIYYVIHCMVVQTGRATPVDKPCAYLTQETSSNHTSFSTFQPQAHWHGKKLQRSGRREAALHTLCRLQCPPSTWGSRPPFAPGAHPSANPKQSTQAIIFMKSMVFFINCCSAKILCEDTYLQLKINYLNHCPKQNYLQPESHDNYECNHAKMALPMKLDRHLCLPSLGHVGCAMCWGERYLVHNTNGH
jgi:hypothetical protein